MTTIELPPDLEAALAEQARKENMTPEQLALDTLRRFFVRPPAPVLEEGSNLYDFIKDYIGTVEGSGEPIARNGRELFADYLEEKKKRGHL